MFLNAMQTHKEESKRKKSEHEGLEDNSSLKRRLYLFKASWKKTVDSRSSSISRSQER